MRGKILFIIAIAIAFNVAAYTFSRENTKTKTKNKWKITVNSIDLQNRLMPDKEEDDTLYIPITGHIYMIVNLTVENKGMINRSFFTDKQIKILINNEFETKPNIFPLLTKSLISRNLAPKQSTSGYVVFQVPEKIIEEHKSMRLFFEYGDKEIYFNLNNKDFKK